MEKIGFPLFLILTIALGIADNHIVTIAFVSIILFIFGSISCFRTAKMGGNRSFSIFYWVFSVYIITAFFVSFAYLDRRNLIFIDCFGYIRNLGLKSFDLDVETFLLAGLVDLEDLNVLHELGYRLYIIFANNYLDGSSIFTLTYAHTAFGILSSIIVYRILLLYVDSNKAYKLALSFAFLSPFFAYSVVCLRDIIIAYIYLLVFDIVLRKFKLSGIIKLLILLFFALGCRLYSGLFIISFIFYYIYKACYKSKYAKLLISIFIIVTVIVTIKFVVGSDIMQQSQDEITGYVEYDADRADGFSSKLSSLPSGFKETALSIYSQIHPFPFYDTMKLIIGPATFLLASIKSTNTLWWYFIFWGLCYALFLLKKIRIFNMTDYLLLSIIAVFIVLNSTQIDVRRIMAVYPLIYFYYVRCYEVYGTKAELKYCNSLLFKLYFVALLIYIIFIQRW